MQKTLFLSFSFLTFLFGHYVAHTIQTPLLYWFVTLPGTIFHEGAHYLSALLLNGQPTTFSIFPTWENGSIATLGHVVSHPNWYNAAIVGLSPLLLLPLALFFAWLAATQMTVRKRILFLYFASCAWAACLPSPQDVSIAMSYPVSLLFAALLFVAVGGLSFHLLRRFLTHSTSILRT
jgi:hypothetical protein